MASVIIFIGVVGWICLLISVLIYIKAKKEDNTNNIKNNIKKRNLELL